jgi:coproporphyrinogen III oxidase-like Fe-S oxidoreductase
MWKIAELEALGMDFSPDRNSFTYTFPPPYLAKSRGTVDDNTRFTGADQWPDLTLYVHIPFCNIDCSFCSLHHEVARDNDIVRDYLDALKEEIRSVASYLGEIPVVAIFFGGGTPSILSADQISGLLDEISEDFLLAESVELCIECAPGVQRSRKEWEAFLLALVERSSLPMNRVSFGVQSFNKTTLRNMGRKGGVPAVLDLLHAVNDTITVYNIDLVLGYPSLSGLDSGMDSARDTVLMLNRLLDSGVRLPSLSLYQLWDTETIRVGKSFSYPEKDDVLTTKWFMQNELFALGYKPSVISAAIRNVQYEHTWAKHRHLAFRHVGLGSGVYSILPKALVQRPRDITGYIRTVQNKHEAYSMDVHYALNEEEILIRKIIMGLRSYGWIGWPVEGTGSRLNEVIKKTERLVGAGLIDRTDQGLRLAHNSYMIANEISSYLHPESYPRKN